ncbi:MAG: DUF2130 domain-containing protein [Mycoplasmoidaceae bacterium]
MGKKVKYQIKDETTLVLNENANAGDIIDLTEEVDLDTKSVIKNFNSQIESLAKEKAEELAEAKALKAVSDKEKEIAELKKDLALLKKDLQANDSQVQDKIDNAVLKAEKVKDDQIHSLKDQIKTLENQWNHRHISTKAMGEELEKFVWEEFEAAQQQGSFPNAKFWKDNEVITSADSLKGSKGDFVFKDYDDKGIEILSVEIEVKTENNTTESKKKNRDHYQKLDNDRKNKKCEYALLVSELEKDNKNFDGIYKVRGFDKMYVVRPQTFVAFINVLKDSLNKNFELVQTLNQKKIDFIDQETFISNLQEAQKDIAATVTRAHNNYQAAIDAIDASIEKLQKTKEFLMTSGTQLTTANTKVQKLTVRKLTKGCKEDPFKK